MIIDKHINFSFFEKNFMDPKINKGNKFYSKYLLKQAVAAASSIDIELVKKELIAGF